MSLELKIEALTQAVIALTAKFELGNVAPAAPVVQAQIPVVAPAPVAPPVAALVRPPVVPPVAPPVLPPVVAPPVVPPVVGFVSSLETAVVETFLPFL
jgi:hypothetical protein